MSKHGEILEIAIVPAGGQAKQVVQRALGKRRAHIRVHSLCDIADASAPTLVLIDGSALQGGESALAEVIIPIAQPKFTKTSMPDNPLLKVPPASRGNRTHAPHAVPLAKRGEPKGGGQL